MNRNRLILLISAAMLVIMLCPMLCFATGDEAEYVPALYAKWWSVIPPLVAIGLALITKEVYSSLFIGVVIGGVLYAGGNFEMTMNHVLQDGIVGSLSDAYNVGILIFLVILGVIVALLNRTGGAAAFGKWAIKRVKTQTGVQLMTIILGILVFIDDYFNCLTVGSVMSPIAEAQGLPRTKLAYLIDSTAAPVCIIAPISSWAAAVTGFVDGENGFALFIKAIPFNFYAILTIVMMFTLVALKFDYGTMKKYADKLLDDTTDTQASDLETAVSTNRRREGGVIDLVLPVIILIIACVLGMIYSGGFFSGAGFVEAFSGSDASVGLVIGSVITLIITVIIYMIRGVISFKDAMGCIPEGFKAMVAPILILTLAWTLKSMTDSLGIAEFVAGITEHFAGSLMSMLPAIIFVIGCVLAFASGTSWGTFGILIPIVVEVFQNSDPQLMIVSISACMAGAVVGDHCSPISDTTIMSSAGAKCNHIAHVSTQIPYAVTAAAVSFVTYIIAGFTRSAWISLPAGIIMMIGTLVVIRAIQRSKTSKTA